MKRRLKELRSVVSNIVISVIARSRKATTKQSPDLKTRSRSFSHKRLLGRAKALLAMTLILAFIFSSESLLAQKKKKNKSNDKATIDTINALNARHELQLPIKKFWDEALRISQKSHRPVLAFNVDYADANSIKVRDNLLRNAEVMIYLSKNFELAVNDFSVDPPPTVGFDSLRNLGMRLDGLEKGYNIVSRPTAIILNSDGSEIERIPNLETYSGEQFIKALKEFLAGKNTVQTLRKEYWDDPKNLDKHKLYLDRLMERFDYDSIVFHYSLLSTNPNYGQTPSVMKEAAAAYAYLRFKQEGNVDVLKQWIFSLDKHNDSTLILAGLQDLLEYYQGRKKIDSIIVSYDRILKFTGVRDHGLLNNFAWDLSNFSTQYDSALSLVNEALLKDPKNPNYYDTKSFIDYGRKDYDAAIVDAKFALKYGQEDKQYFKERVEFYEKEKKRILIEGANPSPSKE